MERFAHNYGELPQRRVRDRSTLGERTEATAPGRGKARGFIVGEGGCGAGGWPAVGRASRVLARDWLEAENGRLSLFEGKSDGIESGMLLEVPMGDGITEREEKKGFMRQSRNTGCHTLSIFIFSSFLLKLFVCLKISIASRCNLGK